MAAKGLGVSRRHTLMGGAGLLGGAGLGTLAACGGPSVPVKKERTSVATVRFMLLGSGTSLVWQTQQVEQFNKTVGAELKINVRPEPEADQTALFTKFQ